MTREQCQSLLPIMQAFAEGKLIEAARREGGPWLPATEPNWELEDVVYRIKPEPLEIEVWVDENGPIQMATLLGPKYKNWVKKKFREVVD